MKTTHAGRRLLSWVLSAAIALSLLSVFPAAAAEPNEVASQITMTIAENETDGKTAMTFNWVMDTSVTSSQLVYGSDPSLSDGTTVQATMVTPNRQDISPEEGQEYFKDVHTFHAVASDLIPGATYYYQLGNAENGYTDPKAFQAPSDPDANAPFSFVVTPDTQGEEEEDFDNTAELYSYIAQEESDAEFLVHTGDLVEDGYSSDQWQWFYEAAEPLLDTMPLMATPGNHDGGSHDTNHVNYKARLNYDTLTMPEGLSQETEGTVYSFAYGDAQFVVLNTNADGEDDSIQYAFLKQQMASTNKAWKIVIMHVPAYDPGSSHYAFDNEVGQKLTEADVDLVLCGHEHAYARNTFLTTADGAQAVQPGEGPTYVVGGSVYNYAYRQDSRADGWSQVFYDLRIDKEGSGGGSIYAPGVYSRVDVLGNALTYTAYYKATGEENDFRVIDTFTIQKSGDEMSQPIGGGTEPDGVTYLWDSFEQEEDTFSARFNWTTDVDTKTGILYYAKKSDFDSNGHKFTDMVLAESEVVDLSDELSAHNYTGGTADYDSEDGGDYCYAPVMSHKAETAALEPDTQYVYCVGDGSANTTSVENPAVITTPAANEDTFEFLFFTDAQQGACGSYDATVEAYEDFGNMLQGAVEEYPDAAFILSGGDQVNYTFDTWQWDAFFEQGKEVFEKYPLYLSVGNHECDGAGNEWAPNSSWDPVDISISSLKGRYNAPENGVAYYGGGDGTERMASGTERLESMAGNYYFVYGDTLFLVLDFQDSTQSGLTDLQQDWVKSVVKQNPTKWRVAVLHKSLFGYRVDDPTEGDYGNWTDTFDEAGIDLVLMGHDHVYTRTNYYAERGNVNNSSTPGSGTTYITGASANTDNRSDYYENNPYVLVHSTDDFGRSYLRISVSPEALRVSVHGTEGGQPTTVENDAVITTVPRTYDLTDWAYPEVPEEVDDLSLTGVSISGIAKEGQTLRTELEPGSATASYLWQRSEDKSDWETIDGADKSSYTVQAADVGSYLRCVATGTGFYHGAVESEPTARVTSLVGGGDVVQITSAQDLQALAENFGSESYPIDAFYELTGELDMSGVTITPIGGAEDTPFLGTFNGKGYAIKNLKIVGTEDGSAGLFAYVGSTGRVVNIVLSQVEVTGSGENTGAIAGASEGLIENCFVTGTVSGHSYTGGIVGRLHGGTLQNCLANVSVTGNNGGGLIGGTNYGGPIASKNENTGNVIQNNLVLGTVTGGDYTGGFVGDMGGSSGAILQTCTGNAVNNSVDAETDNCIAGYWSGSRPIENGNQKNYAVDTLSKEGMSQGTEAFESKVAADFSTKALYEELGWDFTTVWSWDTAQNFPVPRVLEVSSGDDLVTIIATAGRGGSIQPEGYTLVQRGETQTFTFAADEYYEIDTVTIDGVADAEAAAAGSYTFTDVQALHTIDITFRIVDETAGQEPSLISQSAYYNRGQEKNIDLTVNFGKGGLGIAEEDWRNAVESVVIQKEGQTVFDCAGCYWFPSTGYGYAPEILQICYDDMEKQPAYDQLVPGTYDLVVTFANIGSTVCTIPLTVVEQPVHTLTVEGGVISADGVAEGQSVAEIAEQTEVTVTAVIPDGQRFSRWEITGLENVDFSVNPLTFVMPQGDVVVKAVFGTQGGGSSSGGSSSSNRPQVSTTGDGGSVTASSNGTVTITPDEGYQIASITVNGETVAIPADGKLTGLDRNDKVVVTFEKITEEQPTPDEEPFTDVADGAWYADAVQYVYENGMMNGMSEDEFRPGETTNRAMVVTILYRLAGSPDLSNENLGYPFADVDATSWYGDAVYWARLNGITNGTSNTTFNPNGAITREQMAAILYRYASFMGYDVTVDNTSLNAYADASQISSYAVTAMQWSNENGLITGRSETTLAPQGTATRAEVATILMRFCEDVAK